MAVPLVDVTFPPHPTRCIGPSETPRRAGEAGRKGGETSRRAGEAGRPAGEGAGEARRTAGRQGYGKRCCPHCASDADGCTGLAVWARLTCLNGVMAASAAVAGQGTARLLGNTAHALLSPSTPSRHARTTLTSNILALRYRPAAADGHHPHGIPSCHRGSEGQHAQHSGCDGCCCCRPAARDGHPLRRRRGPGACCGRPHPHSYHCRHHPYPGGRQPGPA